MTSYLMLVFFLSIPHVPLLAPSSLCSFISTTQHTVSSWASSTNADDDSTRAPLFPQQQAQARVRTGLTLGLAAVVVLVLLVDRDRDARTNIGPV